MYLVSNLYLQNTFKSWTVILHVVNKLFMQNEKIQILKRNYMCNKKTEFYDSDSEKNHMCVKFSQKKTLWKVDASTCSFLWIKINYNHPILFNSDL